MTSSVTNSSVLTRKNSQHFVEVIKFVKLESEDQMVSFHVETNVPVEESMQIQQKLTVPKTS